MPKQSARRAAVIVRGLQFGRRPAFGETIGDAGTQRQARSARRGGDDGGEDSARALARGGFGITSGGSADLAAACVCEKPSCFWPRERASKKRPRRPVFVRSTISRVRSSSEPASPRQNSPRDKRSDDRNAGLNQKRGGENMNVPFSLREVGSPLVLEIVSFSTSHRTPFFIIRTQVSCEKRLMHSQIHSQSTCVFA